MDVQSERAAELIERMAARHAIEDAEDERLLVAAELRTSRRAQATEWIDRWLEARGIRAPRNRE